MKDTNVSLYVVATPIGNLRDISPRALEVLSNADFIAAEDTRTSGILLNRYGIKKPMISYHEHNAAERGPELVKRMSTGEVCALVSDAGMPAISDPGELLVRACHEAGLTVSVIPGPCAAVTALAMSGMPSRRFTFEGFPSTSVAQRKEQFAALRTETRTMIFYEAPHHLLKTLAQLYEAFGDRELCIVRELTKIYEQAVRTTLGQAVAYYTENDPKGEFVLVVAGAPEEAAEYDEEDLKRMFEEKIASGMTKSEAAKAIASLTGKSRRDIYEMFKEN